MSFLREMKNKQLLMLVAVTLPILSVFAPVNFTVHAQAAAVAPPRPPGVTARTACPINSNVTYAWYIYSAVNSPQYYNFTAYNQQWINITFTPPPSDSGTILVMPLSPSGNENSSTTFWANMSTSYMDFKTTSGGTWSLELSLAPNCIGGNYTFCIKCDPPAPIPSAFSPRALALIYHLRLEAPSEYRFCPKYGLFIPF